MKAYVINLARSTDRRARMVSQMGKFSMPWELIEGADARDLSQPVEHFTTAAMRSDPRFRPGAVGCALSHGRVYEAILRSGAYVGAVLEDDAELPDDFPRLVQTVASRMEGAEVVLLNFHKADGLQILAETVERLEGRRVLGRPADIEGLTSGAAYLVTREACQRLVRALMPMRFFSDDWHGLLATGALQSVRCVAPMPVQQSLDFRTTIDYFPVGSVQLRLRDVFSALHIDGLPFVRRFVRRRRQRHFEKWGALGTVDFVSAGRSECCARDLEHACAAQGPGQPSGSD